jgi:hypothetical protein
LENYGAIIATITSEPSTPAPSRVNKKVPSIASDSNISATQEDEEG